MCSRLNRFFYYKILCIVFISVVLIAYVLPFYTSVQSRYESNKICFQHYPIDGTVELLEDIMEAEKKPELGKSIFFHETSCLNGLFKLNAR